MRDRTVPLPGKPRFPAGRYGILILFALVFVLPLVLMVVSSLKPWPQLVRDVASFRAFVPYGDLSLHNYGEVFYRAPIPLFLLNSLFVTATTVALGLLVNSLAAFSFAFLAWRGKGVVISVIIATYIIPFETIAIPLLLWVNRLPWIGIGGAEIGWLNSYHVQIIPFVASAFQIFLFHRFFRDIPIDYVEAARVDGARRFRIYRAIVLPMSGPVIATAVILRSLDMWNQFMWPLIAIQTERFRPVMVGLLYFHQSYVATGPVMAYLTIVTLPIIIFYLVTQKAFIESIASTGIKG